LDSPHPPEQQMTTFLETKFSQLGPKRKESLTLTVFSLNWMTVTTTNQPSGIQQCKNMFKQSSESAINRIVPDFVNGNATKPHFPVAEHHHH
jgi:hypothetical protein